MVKLVQENHNIGFWKGKPDKKRFFIPLTTFGLRLLKHIRAPAELPQYSGFLVEVSQRQRARSLSDSEDRYTVVTGESFLPWYKIQNSDQLVHHLSPALPRGVLSCQLSNSQTKSYLMQLCQEFFEDTDSDSDEMRDDPEQYRDVTCTGLQPASKIIVFGPNFQLYNDGSCVPINKQEFIWVDSILQKLERAVNCIERPILLLPHLNELVRGIHSLSGDNVFSGVYLLGAGIISMHYESVLARCGSVGIAVATSSISRGKTNCAKVAIAMCGNHPKGCTGFLTDSMARVHLGGALPFLYDDPSSDQVLKPLLMNSFGGVEMGTKRAQFSARCSPIVTCNEFVIDSLSKADDRYLARAVIVPFAFDAPPIRVDRLDHILKNAHHALPEAVSIGEWLRNLPEEDVYEMVDRVQGAAGGRIDGRLAMQYALYTLCAQEKEQVFMMSHRMEYGTMHFVQVMLPSILGWQAEESNEENAGTSNLGKLLKKGGEIAIQSPQQMSQFLQCVAPNVSYRLLDQRTKVRGVAVRLQELMTFLDSHGVLHRSKKAIQKKLRRNKKCRLSKMKQFFLKKGTSVSSARKVKRAVSTCKGCICVPQEMIGCEATEHERLFDDSGIADVDVDMSADFEPRPPADYTEESLDGVGDKPSFFYEGCHSLSGLDFLSEVSSRLHKTRLSSTVVAIGMVQHTSLFGDELSCVNATLASVGKMQLFQSYEVVTYPKVEVNGVIVASKSPRMNSRNDYTIGYECNGSVQYGTVRKLITVTNMHDRSHFALVNPLVAVSCKVLKKLDFPREIRAKAQILTGDFLSISTTDKLIGIQIDDINDQYMNVNIGLTTLVREMES